MNNPHSMDLSAALILASLFFFLANVSCCKFSPAGRCVKTHEFTEDFSVMAGLPREEEVDCPEGRDRCMTGRYQYDPRMFEKQRGTIFKTCSFKLPKPLWHLQCQFFVLGERNFTFSICTCGQRLCNKGETQTKELIRQENQHAKFLRKNWFSPKNPWKGWKPPEEPKDPPEHTEMPKEPEHTEEPKDQDDKTEMPEDKDKDKPPKIVVEEEYSYEIISEGVEAGKSVALLAIPLLELYIFKTR